MHSLLSHPLSIKAQSLFKDNFGSPPKVIVHAPGRFNLIGEHTDYNHGFVLPGAIAQGICFAMDFHEGEHHAWFALDTGDSVTLPVTASAPTGIGWVDYCLGAYRVLHHQTERPVPVRLVFTSDLPAGAGLSSSSALTCGFLLGLNALIGLGKTREELAWLAHLVERNFIGLQGGIMDQHACLLCEQDQLLLLDCLNRNYEHIPFAIQDGLSLFLIDTHVQHKLTNSDYNTRAAECRQALALLQKSIGIQSLREVTLTGLQNHASLLGPLLMQRIEFVLHENARVLSAVESIRQLDWNRVGQLLNESHAGLRDDYQVSCAELDFLAETVSDFDGVLGARMMGGGFGGCTINLAISPPDAAFMETVVASYQERFGWECSFIDIRPSDGALIAMI